MKEKAKQLLNLEMRIFHHSSFDEPSQRKLILADIPELENFKKKHNKVLDFRNNIINPEMRPFYEAPLLNFNQEQHLFRQMNYFKYQAKILISGINLNHISKKRILKIEKYLFSASKIRNLIAECNFRLAIQILKLKYVQDKDNVLSDAYFDVLRSVDYFDWRKGNKFSTYATWVLKKNFFRSLKQNPNQNERLEDFHIEQLQYKEDVAEDKHQLVKNLLNLLSTSANTKDNLRQLFVLENYFGVNGKEKCTLDKISEEIGVTKERVRQLKDKGLLWIKNKIEELDLQLEFC
jgi:RNA polymerase sigma factor (sigma-70 family)